MIKQNIVLALIFTITLTNLFAQKSVNRYDNDGKRHGLWTKNYHNTNQIRYSGRFEHGKEIDTFKYYRLSNGKSVLSAVKVFSPNSNLTEVKFLASTGKIISEGKMNGKTFIGKWIYYHKNSPNIMIAEFFNDTGQLQGERKVFYDNGNLAEVANYKKGKLHGSSQWFSKTNQLLRQSEYKNDTLDGTSVYYDSFGNVTSKGNYKANKKVDIWDYYKDGKLAKKVNHTTGEVLKEQ